MRRHWWLGLGLLIATVAGAESVVPVNQPTPVQTAFPLNFAVPPRTTAIVGWGTNLHFINPPTTLYVAVQFWHDGGTPHMLDEWLFYPGQAQNFSTMLPSGPGHHAVAGDDVFVIAQCFRTDGQATVEPGCFAIRPTFYFRVLD